MSCEISGAAGEERSATVAALGNGVGRFCWGDRFGGVTSADLDGLMFGMTMVKSSAAFVGLI